MVMFMGCMKTSVVVKHVNRSKVCCCLVLSQSVTVAVSGQRRRDDVS